jgi:hypothetical protein
VRTRVPLSAAVPTIVELAEAPDPLSERDEARYRRAVLLARQLTDRLRDVN